MKALWVLFWSVCQMRRAPDEVPYSLPLLAIAAVLTAALGMGTQFLAGPVSTTVAVATVLIALALDALVLWLLLVFKRREPRGVQALTAVYGADFVLGLFAVPLVLGGRLLGESPLVGVVVFAQMLLVGWNLGVRGFIYHRTLQIGILQANMLALTLFLLNIFIAIKLFPELLAVPGAH